MVLSKYHKTDNKINMKLNHLTQSLQHFEVKTINTQLYQQCAYRCVARYAYYIGRRVDEKSTPAH